MKQDRAELVKAVKEKMEAMRHAAMALREVTTQLANLALEESTTPMEFTKAYAELLEELRREMSDTNAVVSAAITPIDQVAALWRAAHDFNLARKDSRRGL